MEQPDWGPRVVRVIAGEIRRHRMERKMSAQALADRCAELGWPIKRSVLSNLESGYRETITVPELFVIAAALEVPPMLLLNPLGQADEVEVLPGKTVSTTDVMLWLRGDKPLPGEKWNGGQDGSSVVASFLVHRSSVDRWALARYYARGIRAGEIKGTDEDIEEHEQRAERAAADLRNLRKVMRVRGLQPPPLPAELAYVDGVVP